MKKSWFNIDTVRAFYLSNYYPIFISLLVLVGSITGFEYYLNILNTALMVASLFLVKSPRPFVFSLCTYIYQLSIKNAPEGYPYEPHLISSGYYFSGWRIYISVAVVASIFIGVIYYFIKHGIYKKLSFKKTPMLAAVIAFSSALMLNGVFGEGWTMQNLLFGFANAFVYSFLFVFLYYAFEEEGTAELAKYIAYISMLMALVISGELIHLFLTSETVFVDGSINKVGVALGWGIWNLIAVSLAVLIPMLFYGMMHNRYPWLYFGTATLAYVMSVLTMSRNALIFSTLTYGVCVIISCFVGKNKRVFRVIVACGVVAVSLGSVLLWDKISALLSDYIERGFSDNGRYALWSAAFENFLKAPVFGNGFYSFNVDTAVFGPLPKMAHNTVLELLSATGVVGLFAYGYYRVKTLLPALVRPNIMKTMLAMSVLVLAFESLLDNFVFNIYPVFYYTLVIVALQKAKVEERDANLFRKFDVIFCVSS